MVSELDVMNSYENYLMDLRKYANELKGLRPTDFERKTEIVISIGYINNEIRNLGGLLDIPKDQIKQDILKALEGGKVTKVSSNSVYPVFIERKKKFKKPKTKRCGCRK